MVFAGQDAWRNHPAIRNCWKGAFPGVKEAAVIFGVLVVAEAAFSSVAGAPKPFSKPKKIKFTAQPGTQPESNIKISHDHHH